MAIKFQIRRDAASNWSSTNPILASGELGFETDMYKLKIGDGSNTWSNLTYISAIGNETIFDSNVSSNAAISSTKLSFNQNTTNSITRTVDSKLKDSISVLDFGAKGDANTDDRQAIVDAVAYAKSVGKPLFFPAGQYLINPANGTIRLEEVTLIGTGVHDGSNSTLSGNVNVGFTNILTLDVGSVFRIPASGNTISPFTIARGVTLDGLGWYYNDQFPSDTPTVYAPTLNFDDTQSGDVQFVYIRNCVSFNSYRWLNMGGDFGTLNAGGIGHIFIENNTICGIHRTIEIGLNREVIKIYGNTFQYGHWLMASYRPRDTATQKYMMENSCAIYYKEGDGLFIENNLFFGQKYGILMDQDKLTQQCHIVGNSFDQVLYGIVATGAGANASFSMSQIVGNSFLSYYGASGQILPNPGTCILLATQGTNYPERIIIDGNCFTASSNDCIWIDGITPRDVTINGNIFSDVGINRTTGSHAAVKVASANTNLLLTGNQIVGRIYVPSLVADGLVVANASSITAIGNDFKTCGKAAWVTGGKDFLFAGNHSSATVGDVSDVISGTSGKIVSDSNFWDKGSGNGLTDGKINILVRKGANQTFTNTETDIDWQSKLYDSSNNFSVSANTFTAPSALGTQKYQFSLNLFHENNGTQNDRFAIRLKVNNNIVAGWSYLMPASNVYNSLSYSSIVQLNGGDSVKWAIQRVDGTGQLKTFEDDSQNFQTISIL